MAKRYGKCISVKPTVYAKIEAAAKARGVTVSTIVEELVAPVIGTKPAPPKKRIPRRGVLP